MSEALTEFKTMIGQNRLPFELPAINYSRCLEAVGGGGGNALFTPPPPTLPRHK